MKKVAAIDIGTNSIRLILCGIKDNNIIEKRKYLEAARIGENVSKSGIISQAAMMRNIEALKKFKVLAEEYGAEQITAIATSAVRDAANGGEFKALAKANTGIDINIIDGEEEADLGVIGALSAKECKNKNILLIDIGGGSTELVLSENEAVVYSSSTNVGAVRITENYITNNPVPDADILVVKNVLRQKFEKAFEVLLKKEIHKVAAIGGTATTVAAMYHKMGIYNPEKVNNTIINTGYLDMCLKQLSSMTLEERYKVVGLQKERADVIVAGFLILQYLLSSLSKKELIISDNDNLEGMVIKYLK